MDLSDAESGAVGLSVVESRAVGLSVAESGAVGLSAVENGAVGLSVAESGAVGLSAVESRAVGLSVVECGAVGLNIVESGLGVVSVVESGAVRLSRRERRAARGSVSQKAKKGGVISLGYNIAVAGDGQTGVTQVVTKLCGSWTAVARAVDEVFRAVAVARVEVTTRRYQARSGRRIKPLAGVGVVAKAGRLPAVVSVEVESGETPVAVARVAGRTGWSRARGNRRVAGNSGVVVAVLDVDRGKRVDQRKGWWKTGITLVEKASTIAVQVGAEEEVRRKKRRRNRVQKTGERLKMAPKERVEAQAVEDTKMTKKDLAKTGWHLGAEGIVCLLLWLLGSLWTLEARGSQDRKSWADWSGIERRSGAYRSAAEGVVRKSVYGSLHAYYCQKRGVGVAGACVVLEVVTQDLVRGQLV